MVTKKEKLESEIRRDIITIFIKVLFGFVIAFVISSYLSIRLGIPTFLIFGLLLVLYMWFRRITVQPAYSR